jgi:hypothetical protein
MKRHLAFTHIENIFHGLADAKNISPTTTKTNQKLLQKKMVALGDGLGFFSWQICFGLENHFSSPKNRKNIFEKCLTSKQRQPNINFSNSTYTPKEYIYQKREKTNTVLQLY